MGDVQLPDRNGPAGDRDAPLGYVVDRIAWVMELRDLLADSGGCRASADTRRAIELLEEAQRGYRLYFDMRQSGLTVHAANLLRVVEGIAEHAAVLAVARPNKVKRLHRRSCR